MSSRIIRLTITSLLIVTILSYVFYWNPTEAAVVLGPDKKVTGPMALILIIAFSVGLLASTCWWLIVGIRYYLRDRRLFRLQKMLQLNRENAIKAGIDLAAGRLEQARNTFRNIVERDPDDIAARVSLATTWLEENDTAQALRVIEEGRALAPSNLELLLFAADLNDRTNNETGVYDNLRLALNAEPKNILIRKRLAESCKKLGRNEEALEIYRGSIPNTPHGELDSLQEQIAELELEQIISTIVSANERKIKIDDLLRKHRDFSPAIAALGDALRDSNDRDGAAKLYTRAYKVTPSVEILDRIASLWLGAEQFDKAIAAVQNLVNVPDISITNRIEGQLYLIALLLRLENFEAASAARSALDQIMSPASGSPATGRQEEKPPMGAILQDRIIMLDALLARRKGNLAEGFETLLKQLEYSTTLPGYHSGSTDAHVQKSASGLHGRSIEKLRSLDRIQGRPSLDTLGV